MDRKKIYPWWFAVPAAAIFFLLCLLPGLLGIGYSFTDWNSFTEKINFVGLQNYQKIFSGHSEYLSYISNTILFTVATTITKTILGLLMALLLTRPFIRLRNVHRMIIFSPQVMSFLVVGLVFQSMLHPTTGFVNNFLRSIGLGSLAQNWLTDLYFVWPSVIAVDTWKGMGYIMMVIIAGLTSIAPEYYEAASMDGANFWQQFQHVTLPLLRPVIVNVTVLNITYGLRVFDMIYALTNGGPGNATGVINTAVYKLFSTGDYAMGTTLSSVLFFFMLALLYFILRSMENKEVEA
ncbi:MAG: sugar ABC transporter permease [Oscillospiraceae bacterium]|nr:sugar ABC transporter permease [Oscillospiraceae bacterium]